MANARITFRFVGDKRDHGHVRLTDFIEQLEAFAEALRQTERLLSGQDQPFIYYRIVDLRHQSPATMTIEGVRRAMSPVPPSLVMRTFKSDLRALSKNKPPARADLAMLEAYRDLAKPLQKHIAEVQVVEAKNKIIPINQEFTRKVEDVIGPDSFSFGSISGRLERVNLHNTFRFEIYPTVGPKRVRCEFKPELKRKVKDALDTYVTVSGRLRYKKWDQYPHAIDAKDVDPHEDEKQLPSLDDLRGVAPEATGTMSSEDFVRAIRDANW